MNPIRRELLDGLFVLVVASLLSVAFEAFQVNFNILLWMLILIGVAIALSGYVAGRPVKIAPGETSKGVCHEKRHYAPRYV
jgi:hypothetical protein